MKRLPRSRYTRSENGEGCVDVPGRPRCDTTLARPSRNAGRRTRCPLATPPGSCSDRRTTPSHLPPSPPPRSLGSRAACSSREPPTSTGPPCRSARTPGPRIVSVRRRLEVSRNVCGADRRGTTHPFLMVDGRKVDFTSCTFRCSPTLWASGMSSSASPLTRAHSCRIFALSAFWSTLGLNRFWKPPRNMSSVSSGPSFLRGQDFLSTPYSLPHLRPWSSPGYREERNK